jgi:cytosine/adenosine deaminase-related metal-dependent hydrolase
MRRLLSALALTSCLLIPLASAAAADPIKIKFTLDWKLQGIHAWYYWAKAKGYFTAENLDVTIDQGEGSTATVTRVTSGALRKPLSPGDYMALIDDVAAAANRPGFNVQYGPNGVQWCSDELLQAVAEASHRTGRRVHMHLLETKYQRQWADATYPNGVVRMLDDIGLLSPRLTLAHCVWATSQELELLAERGVTIAVNTSSNLHLHSGIAPVMMMKERGCSIALGIDSKAFDDDDDSLRELRLAYLLHAGTGFDRPITRHEAVHAAVSNGRFAVTNVRDSGLIEADAAADIFAVGPGGARR